MFDPSVFWPAFAKAGMLSHFATATIGDHDFAAWVDRRRPDVLKANASTLSTEYAMEFQASDFPGLARGDIVKLWTDETKTAGERYRVREAPSVPDDPSKDQSGRWLVAMLTFEATLP